MQNGVGTTNELLNDAFIDEKDSFNVTISNITANDVQSPLPTNGDSVYVKDLWVSESTVENWVDADSTGGDLIKIPFNNLHTAIRNTTSDNPKTILVHFNRTVNLFQVGLGCAEHTGENFSNIKITILGSGGVSRTVLDDSSNNTDYTSKNYSFAPQLGNAIKIEFYTADPVCISNITIQKVTNVASQIQGIQPDGSLINIGATVSSNLKTTDAENGLAIAKGEVIGTTSISKFGDNPDIDTATTPEDIWEFGGLYNFSTTADIDSISSSDATDLQDVIIQGLDANWDEVTQAATLTGQTRVALSTPLIRCYRMYNDDNTDFAGSVYAYVNTTLSAGVPVDTTKIRAMIDDGNNQTLMAIYTVPAGKTAYFMSAYVALSNTKVTSAIMTFRARGFNKVFRIINKIAIQSTGNSNFIRTPAIPGVFPEKTDVLIRCEEVTSNDTAISAGFDLVLVDN